VSFSHPTLVGERRLRQPDYFEPFLKVTSMRFWIAPGLLAAMLFTPGFSSAQSDTGQHGGHSVQGGGTLPAGWSARPDDDSDVKEVKFVTMEPGYHLTLGPATILFREQDRAAGPFHTLARFHQMKKLKHAEGYGILFGGEDLSGKEPKYTYFLVREDGSYLIKRRDGETTSEITKGWTPHPAIKKSDAEGKSSNLLEIDAKQDPQRVAFKVNGQTVYTENAKAMPLKGIVGLRVNHNLDLHIQDFAVHQ
jgi:hypothetical protein